MRRRTVMWPDDWEIRCIRPGVWIVEGYEVVRVRKRWYVTVGVAYGRRDIGSALLLDDVVTLIDHDLHDVSESPSSPRPSSASRATGSVSDPQNLKRRPPP
jgi:hypothetical protein